MIILIIIIKIYITNINIMYDQPWIEKYRPRNLNKILGNQNTVKLLNNALVSKNIPHLLFHGPPGTGKTTTILAFARELYNYSFDKNVLELNASDDRGIAVVRTQILQFVKTVTTDNPLHVKYKLIILDEADAMTIDAQIALRKIIEDYSDSTRFCFICNYINKITYPIISRCVTFKFNSINGDNIFNHLKSIAQIENLLIKDDIIVAIVETSLGDLRKAIGLLQNINYYQRISRITPQIIYDMNGDIPINIVSLFISLIKDKTISINKRLTYVDLFSQKGYSVKKLCEKIIIYGQLGDSQIYKLIKILLKLDSGANSTIQLINIICLL